MLSFRHLRTSWWSALVMCGLIFGNRFFSWTCSLCCKNQTNINLFSASLAQFWTRYFYIIVMTGSLAEKEFSCNFPGYDKDKIVMSFELLIVFSWIRRTLLSVLGFLSGSRLIVICFGVILLTFVSCRNVKMYRELLAAKVISMQNLLFLSTALWSLNLTRKVNCI